MWLTRGGLRTVPRILLAGLALLALSAIVPSASMMAQRRATARARGEKPMPLDSVQLAYRFKAGQSITYRAVSRDSILLYDVSQHTLVRNRVEMVNVRCDSVLDGGYLMTLTTTGYAATERIDTLPPITRTSHPWVGRKISFVMSNAGRRIDLVDSPDPGDSSGVAPGAPFQPLLLPFFGDEAATYIGSSQNFNQEDLMLDNVYPPIHSNGAMFRVVSRRLDTLRRKAVDVGLSSVETIAYVPPPVNGQKNIVKATINGGGNYYFVPKLGYPLGGLYGLIANFTIESLDGKRSVSGRHFIDMTYQIAENDQ
jgi:hypothetical protein